MIVSDFSQKDIAAYLNDRLYLNAGPFAVSVYSKSESFARSFYRLYQDYSISLSPVFADYHIKLAKPKTHRAFWRPQVQFLLDGHSVFQPMPSDQAFPIFEWGLNWAIGNHCHHYLVIHAGVLEKNGYGLLMPGMPGSGKSTLCAALILKGWRLLSDELALIDLDTGCCIPIPRPVSLKNRSIEIIQNFSENALLSDTVHDTQKGSVAYLKVPKFSVEQANIPAKLCGVVFPRYQDNCEYFELNRISRARAFMGVADQAFNYHILGISAFKTLTAILDNCECYEFIYNGNLVDAEAVFNGLAEKPFHS